MTRLTHCRFRRAGQFWMLLVASSVVAPGPAGSQTVVDEVEVRVVEIDVSVRDRRGRGVVGLGKRDFTVSVGGAPVDITNFRAVVEAEETTEALPGSSLPDSVEPRNLVLYFDETSLDSGERDALAKSLASNLERGLRSDAEIMVAGRQGFGLAVYQPFTAEKDRLVSAMERAVKTAPNNPTSGDLSEFLREVERTLSAIEEAPSASTRARSRVLAARGTTFVSEALQRVERSADVLDRLLFALGGLPGRTGLLYVGDGLAVNPGEVVGGALREAFSRFEMRSISDSIQSSPGTSLGGGRLAEVAQRAASRGVTIYALDTSGRQSLTLATAEHRSMDAGRSGGAAPTDTWTPGVSSRRRSEIQSALQSVAEKTGGRLFADRRDDLLEVLAEDLGTYYSLGVVAAGELELEDSMSFEVSVKGRGLRVHRRRAASPRPEDTIDAERTLAALLGGNDNRADRLGARIVLGEIRAGATEDGHWAVPLAIRVPVAALRVEARGRRHEGQLSIFLATWSGQGELSAVRKTVLPVGVSNSDLATAVGRDAEYRVELQLPSGTAHVVVGVRDDLAPELNLVSLGIEVGEPPASPKS